MIRKIDFVTSLLEKEVVKFVKNNGSESIAKMQTKDFVNGSVVLNIPIKRTAISSLLNECRFPVNKESFGTGDFESNYINFLLDDDQRKESLESGNFYKNLFNKITDQIIKIDKPMSFEACLNMAIKFRNQLGSKFYGCMLKLSTNSDIVINPFHILTTLSCIDNSSTNNESLNVLKEKFYLIVYVNQDEEELDFDYGSMYSDMALVDKNINSLMQVYSSKIEQKVKLEEESVNVNLSRDEVKKIINGGTVDIKYRTSIEEDVDESYNYYVIATQAGTNGIMFPFYGASLIRMTKTFSESKGTTLSPFNSVNIAGAESQTPQNIVYNSVCTGSTYTNTTIDGLRMLVHSNYSSPYSTSKLLHPGCLVYARRMIEKSLEIYRKAQFINFEEPEDMSIDFIKLLNDCKNYSNIKNNITEKEIDINGMDVSTSDLIEPLF